MATQVVQNSKIWLDQFNLSSDLNSLAIDYSAEMLDDTVFGDDTRSNKGGLKKVSMSMAGFWQAGTDLVDEVLFSTLFSVADAPCSISPEAGASGERAFLFQSIVGEYGQSGSIGDLYKFTATAQGTGKLIRGLVGINSTVTASGNGTGYQLGAVSSTQKLYAALHVIGPVTGTSPTLDVIIQRDDNAGFTSPATALTFTQATAKASQWLELAGAVTDDYFRVNYTVGGTTPSFPFVVTFGVI